eukprot:2275078-Rhodomonas_salina.1
MTAEMDGNYAAFGKITRSRARCFPVSDASLEGDATCLEGHANCLEDAAVVWSRMRRAWRVRGRTCRGGRGRGRGEGAAVLRLAYGATSAEGCQC